MTIDRKKLCKKCLKLFREAEAKEKASYRKRKKVADSPTDIGKQNGLYGQ